MKKILLVLGDHDTGKTWFSRRLQELAPEGVNIVKSYTSRKEREDDRKYGSDHLFVDKENIENFLDNPANDIVAFTVKDGEYYMAFEEQFDDDKLNVYTVDWWGLVQTRRWAENEGGDCRQIAFNVSPIPSFALMDSELQDKLCKDILRDYGLINGQRGSMDLSIELLTTWLRTRG